ncbi:hypothetical protein M5050_11285, partial [Neisseria meningitidis]|nr:hypothetical protein [Neisseria meningitidis]
TLIRRKLSPEQVCAYLCKHHQITLHHSTIYRYLRQDKSNGSTIYRYLRQDKSNGSTIYRYLRQDKSNGSTLWQHLRICSKPYRKRYGSTWTRGKVP